MRGGSVVAAAFAIALIAMPRVMQAAAINSASAIVAADFNHDGALDLAVAITSIVGGPPHPGSVSVILQNPAAPGTFFHGVAYPTIADPIALAVGDLNGDQLPDLVVASSSGTNLGIMFQDPNNPGTFLPATKVPIGITQSGVAIGDLNGDGLPDIALAVNTRNLKILYQDPSGPPGTFVAPVDLALNRPASAVAIGDLDGDGFNDLALVLGGNNVGVLLQDHSAPGNFLAQSNYKVGAQPFEITIGDINGDGIPDLAVADLGPPNTLVGGVSVLLQNASPRGAFAKSKRYAAGSGTQEVVIGDFNGDGRADLAAANSGELIQSGDNFQIRTSVSLLLQKKTRSLAFTRKRIAIKNSLAGVAMGDFNGDGRLDLAGAIGPGASIIFQKTSPPGAFLPPKAVGR